MKPPRISICIPTAFDRLRYLVEAVASAQVQRLRELEILIGNDGDSREVRDWAQAAAAMDGRVRYLKAPRRLGLAGNWNFLADAAAGEYIALIGDDDRLLPGFADRMLREAAGDVDVVFSQHWFIDECGRRLPFNDRNWGHGSGRGRPLSGMVASAAETAWPSSVPMSSCIVRTNAVRRLRFKTHLDIPQLELFSRLSREGRRFVFVPEYLAEYRSHLRSDTARGDIAGTRRLRTSRYCAHRLGSFAINTYAALRRIRQWAGGLVKGLHGLTDHAYEGARSRKRP